MSNLPETRSRIVLHFVFCFFLLNTFLALLLCLNYIDSLPDFNALAGEASLSAWIWFFFSISFIAQIGIVFLACCLVVNIMGFIIPRIRLIGAVAVLLTSALFFSLIADSVSFRLYHMHYASVGWEVFRANAFSQVLAFSLLENLWLIGLGLTLIIIESVIAYFVLRYVNRGGKRGIRYLFLSFIILSIVVSYTLNYQARNQINNAWLSNTNRYLMVKATRFIPYYNDVYSILIPIKNTLQAIVTASGNMLHFKINDVNPLHYPKHNLQCHALKKPLNIVIIAIDTWRYDAMNSKVTPNIYQFSQQALRFENHWSGGNCTKAGIFSLFYGLPANYWDAFYEQQKGPALIQSLQKENYQIGVFASAQLNFPSFDKTVFRDIEGLNIYTEGDNTLARDQATTHRFQQFILGRDTKKPFFSFLFYDAAHNYCETAVPTEQPFKPIVPVCNRFSLTKNSDPTAYLNRYRNAVHFIDKEVGKVLALLANQQLLQNTIVIITADHGEEINDKQSGYWQHASAYTAYQLHTPFIMHWPHKGPAIYHYFTSHYDLVPTLMTSAINCKNKISDYSTGRSLFTKTKPRPLISGGYADYAILANDQILRIYKDGDYTLDDGRGHPIEAYPKETSALKQAFASISDYFN